MKIGKLYSILIGVLLAVNIYGNKIQTVFNLNRQIVVLIVVLGICFSGILAGIGKKIEFDKRFVLLFATEIIIMSAHVMIFNNVSGEVSMLLYFIVFFIIGVWSKLIDYRIVLKSIVVISSIMCIEALYYYKYVMERGWRAFNVRIFTSAPKEDYTYMVTISFVILLSVIMTIRLSMKQRYLCILLMLVDLFVNIVIMQSKTMILVIVIDLVVIYYISNSIIQQILRKVAFFSVLLFFAGCIFKPDLIPDYIYVMINKVTGLMGKRVEILEDSKLYSGTYNQRGVIFSFVLKLFMRNFFFGIGFNRFALYSSASSNPLVNAVVQTESGLFNAFVEGGIIFGCVYIYTICSSFIRCLLFYINRRCISFEILVTMLLSLSVFVLSVNNDTNSVTYWCVLSVIFFFGIRVNSNNKGVINIKHELGIK